MCFEMDGEMGALEDSDVDFKVEGSVRVIYEPTTKDSSPTQESDSVISIRRQTGRTWFPILLGALCGIIAFMMLAMFEAPSFYRIAVWLFKESSPKALFAMPAYYCIHRTILLVLAAVGGSIGVLFSQWRRRTSFIFLLVVLIVIAAFAAVGFH
jgi:hypothetical protein